MKTEPIKPAISILVLVLLALMIPGASAESMRITDTHGDPLDYAIKGDALTILISSESVPVAGADFYFRLNDETPVHTMTNDSGMTAFKPLSIGVLKISAEKDGEAEANETELRVLEKESILQIQAPSSALRDELLMVRIVADGEPVAGVDVYFRLNEWVPVHVRANATGTAAFKPLVSGTLQITAKKGTFEPATASILVSELQNGDLNDDGVVTAADAVIALEIAAGGSASCDPATLTAAEVSGDGVVTSLDALMILQAAAGAIAIC